MAQINLLAPFRSSVTLGRFPRYAQSSGWLTPLLHGWAKFFEHKDFLSFRNRKSIHGFLDS